VILIPDFVAFPFGNTVLCVGSDDAVWPPDIDLLANLYANRNSNQAHAAAPADNRGVAGIARAALILTVLATLIASSIFLFNTHTTYAANAPAVPADTRDLAEQVSSALHVAKLDGLHATAKGGMVVIDGMVLNSAEDVAARTLFEHFGERRIARQYDVAQSDIANLEDSMGIDGVRFSYKGGGVFAVAGPVPSMTDFNDALNRVRADLDTNIKQIDVSVTEAPAALPTIPYLEMIAVNGVHYVETTDGVKHLFPVSAAVTGHDNPHQSASQP